MKNKAIIDIFNSMEEEFSFEVYDWNKEEIYFEYILKMEDGIVFNQKAKLKISIKEYFNSKEKIKESCISDLYVTALNYYRENITIH